MSKIITLTITLALAASLGMPAWAQDEPVDEISPAKETVVESPAKAEKPAKKAKPRHHDHDDWEPASVFVPLGLWIVIVLVVAFSLQFRSRKIREVHTTLRAMVEKGAEIPPDLLTPPARKDADLRRGVIYLGSGLGWLRSSTW